MTTTDIVLREGAVLSKPLKLYVVKYDSNNSGGSWWLKDEDWKALEKAGWTVDWRKDDEGNPTRWLDALATNAEVKVEVTSMSDAFRMAVTSWKEATGQNPGSQGCNCCGSPHSFSGETGTHGEEGWEESYLYDFMFRQVSYEDPW